MRVYCEAPFNTRYWGFGIAVRLGPFDLQIILGRWVIGIESQANAVARGE